MTEQLKQKLNDSAVLRWSVLALVAFTMLCGYFLTDVMSPLKPMLEKELLWDSLDYGFFTSAYGWFNVFLLMLIFGGIILDKMGVRFTGMGACLLMVFGCGLKYYAITTTFPEGAMLFGFKMQVTLAALGYAIFGVGVEIAGITVSKIIVKWFKGKEMALAMGLEMATARIGTTLAMVLTVPLADFFGSTDESGVFHTNIPAPILFCLVMLCVGTIAFFIYTFYDKKLDALEDLIEAANGKPVFVAYWYQPDSDRIVERFKAVPLKAAGDIRKWKEGKIPVAAIHPASAGHGLNIQDGGHILIWFGLTWSLELYMQCNARLWRQGQRETVMIYHIVNKGTLDEDAMRSLEQKDCGQSAIIDAVKARIGGVNGASRKDD